MSVTTNYLISGVPSGTGGGGTSFTDWNEVVATTTYTLDPTKPYVACTHATGTTVTVPSGLGAKYQWLILQAAGAGPVQLSNGGGAVTLLPSSPSTLATSGVGQMLGVITTEDASNNEFAVSGATAYGPRFLGYAADYPTLLSSYPVSGAAITALNYGDNMWVENYGQPFVPNVAKTRMVAQSRRVTIAELGGTLANPVVAAITTTGLVSISLPQLPAYLAQPGDRIEVIGLARHTAGGTPSGTELQLKLGTANSAADQTIAKIATSSANNQDGGAFQFAWVYDTTTVGATQLTIPNSSSTSVQNTPSPLAFNSLQYFNLNMAALAAGDTFILTQLVITLIQKR